MASVLQAKIDAKNKGKAYVQDKYGMAFYNKYQSQLERATGTAPGRAKGQSQANKAPTPTGQYTYDGVRLGFGDGGEAPTEMDMTNVPLGSQGLQLNLENDSALAQGSHTQWAQPTSISSLITGLLKESQTPQNYWQTFGQNANGQVALNQRSSSAFGYDVSYTPNAQSNVQEQTMIGNNPYGAFGTQQVMQEEDGHNHEGEATTTSTGGTGGVDDIDYTAPGYNDAQTNQGPTGANYNPWGFGQGGDQNQYGPNSQYMAQAQMEAMGLANQYFAPQRMELAYELGDMETDMRRLAANLGRQVDDPTLQAKLYKEAMRSVRTLDVQQNTLALQMADQRRKEELQNFQYYDALAQQEYQLRWANQQFYDNLGLQSAYFDLQNSIGMAQPYSTSESTTKTDAPQSQVDSSLMGIYQSMMKNNPYRNGGNLL